MNASDLGSVASRTHDTSFRIARILQHQKRSFLVAFSIGIVLTMSYFALATRYFQSDAKLFVKLGRETVSLDPTATTGQSISVREAQSQQVFAVEELLNSRLIAESVVDDFGPEVILAETDETTEDEGSSFSIGEQLAVLDNVNLNPLKVYSIRDKAVKLFRKKLGVLAGKKTNILSVSYKSKSPQFSHDVLKKLIEVSLEEYVRMNRIQGSQEFFVNQSNLLREQLNALEEQLRDLKSETGLASLETQRSIHLTMLGSLEEKLLVTESELIALESELEERRDRIRTTAKMIVLQQTTDQPQTVGQSLREKLYDLEVQERELSSRLTDTHPSVIQIRKQIADARSIAQQEAVRPAITEGRNPNYQAAEIAIAEREAKRISLTSMSLKIKEDIKTAKADLAEINNAELAIRKLEREIALAHANYLKYSENLEQARIDQEIEAAKISSLNIMQAPTYVKTPVTPKPLMTLVLGLILSILLGTVIAVQKDSKMNSGVTMVRPAWTAHQEANNGHSLKQPQENDVVAKEVSPPARSDGAHTGRLSSPPHTPR